MKDLWNRIVAKVKAPFVNNQGKTILKVGDKTLTTGFATDGKGLVIMKNRSNFWTRLKNLVLLPWRYLRHGRIEL